MEDYQNNNAISNTNGGGKLSKNKKSPTLTDNSFENGYRRSPQATDLEAAVLGAILIDRDAMTNVLNILKPESFYDEKHRDIYQAMLTLFQNTKPIDALTVSEELRKMGSLEKVGGAFYLIELTRRVASAANTEYHALIVAQKFIQRELIRVGIGIVQDAYDETLDVFEVMDAAEKNLFDITENNMSRGFEGMPALTAKVMKLVEELNAKEDGLTGVPTGLTELDKITGGWQKSDLIVIAARPAMGKTACVLSMALNAARDYNKPVAFFSLEMAATQLVVRLLGNQGNINVSNLRKGKLENTDMGKLLGAVDGLSQVPIFIDDTPAINIFELRAKCRRLKAQKDIQMIIIDYLQLMSGPNSGGKGSGNREQEISAISRGLKGLAKELDVPVIALSQLSRNVESRGGDKKPLLSDLRESGAIEQDADIVAFIYRPEYYKIEQDELGNSTKGKAYINVAKHRNGELAEVPMSFVGEYARFEDSTDNGFGDFSDFDAAAITNTITLPSRMNLDDIPF